MGTLKVTIAVGDSQGRQFEELERHGRHRLNLHRSTQSDAQQDGGSRSKGRHPPRLPTAA